MYESIPTSKRASKRQMWVGLLAVVMVGSGNPACAGERLGPVYPVVEPHMIDAIKGALKEKEKSGELARLQREAIDRSKRSIEEPPPVAGLTRTQERRTYHIDPSVTQATPILDNQGRTIVAAGTRVNPLEYVTLSSSMLFFDGRDPEQVNTAFALIDKHKDAIKPVMVGGRPLDMMRKRKVRMYFDQGGDLVRRFGIRDVSAIVSQDGYRLRVEEFEVKP